MFKKTFTRWNRYNRTVKELNGLTDRELSDIGISRFDIASVARQHTSSII